MGKREKKIEDRATRSAENGLTLRQQRFAFEYFYSLDVYAAYNKTHPPHRFAKWHVFNLAIEILRLPAVKAYLEKLRSEIEVDVVVSIQDVLKTWVDIATADPNDLVQIRRNCCRFCWGKNNDYQWTKSEYALEVARILQIRLIDPLNKVPDPDRRGGTDFDASRIPNPNCGECHGVGVVDTFVCDTRLLTGKAKTLYAGVKQTTYGPQILMRDQDSALENIAKYLGMFVERHKHELTGNNDKNIPQITKITIDQSEAATIYRSVMEGD